jgi:dGTPase
VRNGIYRHSKGKGKIFSKQGEIATLEAEIVRISDIIAYVNHDLDDAMRAGVLKKSTIPPVFLKIGESQTKRIDTMVKDVIYTSRAGGLKEIKMSRGIQKRTYALRDFLYENIYESKATKKEFKKAKKILYDLYYYYLEHTDEVFKEIPREIMGKKERIVCDFIAGMTDRFAIMMYEKLFLPQPWMVF